MIPIPERTIERLCAYRRILLRWRAQGKTHFHSHELADEARITSAQVRRDMMSLNTIGTPKTGYLTAALIDELGSVIEGAGGQRLILVGAGNLGSALVRYAEGLRPDLTVVAALDTDPAKVGTDIAGVPCLPLDAMDGVVRDLNALIGIITVPSGVAQDIATRLVDAGVKALVNLTSVKLKVPPTIFVQDVDISVYLEKSAYFARVLTGSADPAEAGDAGRRVLCIDDDAPVAERCREALAQAGFGVEAATDYARGVAAAQDFRPDVIVICAASLPRGARLARALRKDPSVRFTPILMLVPPKLLAQMDRGPRRAGNSLPVDALLDNTAAPHMLLSATRRLLGLPRHRINAEGGAAAPRLPPRSLAA